MTPKRHDQVVRYLKSAGIPAAELARRVGVSPAQITRYSQGQIPKLAVALRLEEVAGIPLHYWTTVDRA